MRFRACINPNPLDYICQGIYNFPRHAPNRKTVRSRPALPRPGRAHAPPPAQSGRGQGNLRLLFRGNPRHQPTENFAPPGLSAPGQNRSGAAPGTLDALPRGDTARCGCGIDFEGNLDALEAEAEDEARVSKARLRLLPA